MSPRLVGHVIIVTIIVVVLVAASSSLAIAGPLHVANAEEQSATGEQLDQITIVGESNQTEHPATNRLHLITGETISIADSAANFTTDGSPVDIITLGERTYLIPEGVERSRYDRSLFDRDVLQSASESGEMNVLIETNASVGSLETAGLKNITLLESATVVAATVSVHEEHELQRLVSDGIVDYISLDRTYHVETDQAMDHGETGARFDSAPGTGVTVAVLDTGIDSRHPDLADAIIDRVDFIDGEHPGDTHGHGTHVAGIVAGTGHAGPNGSYSGVAPGASLVDVRVMDEHGAGEESTIIAGIEYAVTEANVDIIVISIGSSVDGSDNIAKSVEWATQQGVIVVASAGNRGNIRSISAAARPPGAIAVGATGNDGDVMPYSSYGPTLEGHLKPELVAPGNAVIGPRAQNTNRIAIDAAGYYTRMSGTSVAAPHVAGAAAALLAAEPDLTPAEIQSRLVSTARPLDGNLERQGGGELDLNRALNPDIVIHDAVLDFGLVETNTTRYRTVTITNYDQQAHTLEFSGAVSNLDVETRSDNLVSVPTEPLLVEPGDEVTVTFSIHANSTPGAYVGSIQYSVAGDTRSLPVGFVRGGTVTVEKRPLSPGSTVDGDELWVLTEAGTHDQLLEFTNGSAHFVAGGGTYMLWSTGTDQATGTTIFMSERHQFDGPTTVILDERNTVPIGIDAGPLEAEYGPLSNLSLAVSMSGPYAEGTARRSVSLQRTDSREIRMSPDSNIAAAVSYVLVPQHDRSALLDVDHVFHLVHSVPSVTGPSVINADPDSLITTEHRYHRQTVDERYRIRDRVTVHDVWNYRPHRWYDIGDRTVQHVHRFDDGANYERFYEGDVWSASRYVGSTDTGEIPILAHPLFGLLDVHIDNSPAVSVTGIPFTDGSGTSVAPPGNHELTVVQNGVEVGLASVSDGKAAVESIPLENGDHVEFRVFGDQTDGHLSTKTVTETVLQGYDADGDQKPTNPNSVPVVTEITFDGSNPVNAIDPGDVRVRYHLERINSVINPTIWYSTTAPEHPPWVDRAEWLPASTSRFEDAIVGDFAVDNTAESISVAGEFQTIRGHQTRLMTTKATHVGQAPNTSTAVLGGHIVGWDGTPVANGTVMVQPVDGGTQHRLETDEAGRFSIKLPRDRSYELAFIRGAPYHHLETAEDDTPAWLPLSVVDLEDDYDMGRIQIPHAHDLRIVVVDERGEFVEGAIVTLEQERQGVTIRETMHTRSDGEARRGNRDQAGIALSGSTSITIKPPVKSIYPDQTHLQMVDIDSPTMVEIALETADPHARLSAYGTLKPGEPIHLDATRSEVPAGVLEYRWDLTGDGETDVITSNPVLKYVPEIETIFPRVTVVDTAGKSDSARVYLPIFDRLSSDKTSE